MWTCRPHTIDRETFSADVQRYLIHAPFFSDKKEDHQAKWKQMEEMKAQGLTKSIGLSNYLAEQIDWILETAVVPPVLNQIEFHAYLQHHDLMAYHKSKNIAVEAYGPLTPVTKGVGGPADGILASLAKKYGVNPTEICLRWCIDQDIIPITTSGKEQRLSDYLRAMTFKLTPKEIKEVSCHASRIRRRIALLTIGRSTRQETRSTCVGSGRTSTMPTTSDRPVLIPNQACKGDVADRRGTATPTLHAPFPFQCNTHQFKQYLVSLLGYIPLPFLMSDNPIPIGVYKVTCHRIGAALSS